MDMTGKTVGHYHIGRKLGGGGMGVVYRARDVRLERPVAVKFLSEEFAASPQAIERFRREARASSAMNHPNICTIFDIGEAEGRHFLVMEMLEGQTLTQRLSGGPLAIDEVISIGIQVASALEVAHAKRIVHRDLKPTNIFVTDRGEAKILDFGLAKLLPERRKRARQAPGTVVSPSASDPALLTSPGMVMGTIAYMSPEQARGEQVDHRTDLFSFGVVLYEMCTGARAFPGNSSAVIFDGLLNRHPHALSSFNPNAPTELEMIVYKALEKDRTMRYQSASDLCTDLKRLKRVTDSGHTIPASGSGPSRSVTGWSSSGSHVSETVVGRATPSGAVTATVISDPGIPRTPDPAAATLTPPPLPAPPSIFWQCAKSRKYVVAAAVGLAALVAGAAVLTNGRPEYYPFVVVGDIQSKVDSVPSGLVEFTLKRSLSQYPGATVVDTREFARAQALESARQSQGSSGGGAARKFLRLAGFGGAGSAKPALQFSGEIRESLGGLEMEVFYDHRGRKGSFKTNFHGPEELLSRVVDATVRQVAGMGEFPDRPAAEYRPAALLLTQYWDALTHYWRGVQAWNRLEMGAADREVTSALQIDPSFALARVTLAELRSFQERWGDARSETMAAQKSATGLTEIDRLRLEALLARASAKPFEERKYLQALVSRLPHRREYVYELAESYFHTADLDQAILKYRDALKLDDNYALAYNHLGYCYAWKGDFQNAAIALNRYHEIDKSANSFDSRGDVYMHAGDYASAAEMKRQAVERDPSLYYAKRGLAYIHIFQGQHRAAEKLLHAAIASTPDASQKSGFLSALAFLYYRQGDFANCKATCEKAIALRASTEFDDRNIELTWLMSMAALETKNLPQARAGLAKLRSAIDAKSITEMNYKPVFKYWLLLSMRLDAEEGKGEQVEKAMSDLNWIKDKLGYWASPFDRAFCFDQAGIALEKAGRKPQAEQTYLNALAYNSHYTRARFHLGALRLSQGRKSEGKENLDVALAEWKDADPSLAELLEARRLLQPI